MMLPRLQVCNLCLTNGAGAACRLTSDWPGDGLAFMITLQVWKATVLKLDSESQLRIKSGFFSYFLACSVGSESNFYMLLLPCLRALRGENKAGGSGVTTTAREQRPRSQGENWRPTVSSSMPLLCVGLGCCSRTVVVVSTLTRIGMLDSIYTCPVFTNSSSF